MTPFCPRNPSAKFKTSEEDAPVELARIPKTNLLMWTAVRIRSKLVVEPAISAIFLNWQF
jgi:hypothetical protein